MEKVKYGYMDGVDWQHEVGEASGGNTIYPSLADLKKHQLCVEGCGAVKVAITLSKWVKKQNLTWDITHADNADKLAVDQAVRAMLYVDRVVGELTPEQKALLRSHKSVMTTLIRAVELLGWNILLNKKAKKVTGLIIGTEAYVRRFTSRPSR